MKRYKDKISVWRGALSMVVLALALVGCTKEPINPDGPLGGKLQLQVVVPRSTVTRATENGLADENRLDKIAVLVFDKSGKLETKIFIPDLNDPSVATSHPQWASDQTLALPIVGQLDPRNIYVIANWTPPTIDESTYTETMLNAEYNTIAGADDINGAKAYPMLMSGVTKGVTTSPNVTVDVARQIAKIRTSVTVPKIIQENNPNIEWLTDRMTITVASVLDQSYILAGQSTSSPSGKKLISMFGKFGFTDVDDHSPAQIFPISIDNTWRKNIIYVNESLPSAQPLGMDTSTFIVIQLPYKNHTTGVEEVDNYYKVYVGEQKGAHAPYRVFRNTIYDLKVTLLGLGMPFDKVVPSVNVEDQLTVLPWERGGEVDAEAPQNDFKIDRTQLKFQYMAETQTVNIATDVTDWKLVERSADNTLGATILSAVNVGGGKTHVADGIEYSLTGTAANVTLSVKKLQDVAPTIDVQRFYFVARNLKVPFTISYDNGFIPSVVLSKTFTLTYDEHTSETIEGWPTDKLPQRGLQIAKRGDKILPSDVAQADDPSRQWRTTETKTEGADALDVGMGAINTDAMIAAGADEHPAAKYCRDMGEGWYLPSGHELLLIYNSKATLGASYSFNATGLVCYWSSTHVLGYMAWIVGFADGRLGGDNQTNGENRVRCVRNI